MPASSDEPLIRRPSRSPPPRRAPVTCRSAPSSSTPTGRELAAACNAREALRDPTAHAEILALRAAAAVQGEWRLEGCTLAVTVEPCTMCAGAIGLAGSPASCSAPGSRRRGRPGSLWDVLRDRRQNHRPEVVGGCAGEGVRGAPGVVLRRPPVKRQQRVAAYAVPSTGRRRCCSPAGPARAVRSGRCRAAGWTTARTRPTPPSARCTRRPATTVRLDRLLIVHSFRRSSPTPPIDFHGIQIVYAATVIGGELCYEVDGSTDMAAWYPLAEVCGARPGAARRPRPGRRGPQLSRPAAITRARNCWVRSSTGSPKHLLGRPRLAAPGRRRGSTTWSATCRANPISCVAIRIVIEPARQLADDRQHLADQLRVQRRGDLVEQQQPRAARPARGRSPPAAAARRTAGRGRRRANLSSSPTRPSSSRARSVGLLGAAACAPRRGASVTFCSTRHVREQVERLEHDRHPPLRGRRLRARGSEMSAPSRRICPSSTVLQQVDAAQQRRLARARRADQRDDLVLVHAQVDAASTVASP